MQDIKIGGRVGFDKIEDLKGCFKDIDFPIELALPWKYQDLWLPVENRLNEILDFFLERRFEILSIHATQGRISEESFLVWGKKTLDFAEKLGVEYVTIHPEQVKSNRVNLQEKAVGFIRVLERESSAKFCVETFSGKRRLLRPSEIIERGLPMTLDVAHIHDDALINQIIDKYWKYIKILHLSARGEKGQHLPINSFCSEVVKSLLSKDWSGNIILEYLPQYHHRLRSDIDALREHILYGKELELEHVNAKFDNGFHKIGV